MENKNKKEDNNKIEELKEEKNKEIKEGDKIDDENNALIKKEDK